MPRSRTDLPKSQRQYIPAVMPAFVDFQHPRLVDAPPSGLEWVHEIKHDGYRMQAVVVGGKPTLWTRNGLDWTDKFPELASALSWFPNCIIDAELVARDKTGRSDFSALRASISPGKTGGLILQAFDLMWLKQEDLRPYALAMRKAMLEELLDEQGEDIVRFVGQLPQGGPAMLKAACELGLEGIVSKRIDAPYKSGRTDGWVKAKCRPGQELVIGGWRQEPGRAFKALLVGYYDRARLVYAGSVKTGFSGTPGLLKQLRTLEAEASPFAVGAPSGPRSELHWTRPELVAAVDFAEWTRDGKLRQSSFKGLRPDKAASEVRREAAKG